MELSRYVSVLEYHFISSRKFRSCISASRLIPKAKVITNINYGYDGCEHCNVLGCVPRSCTIVQGACFCMCVVQLHTLVWHYSVVVYKLATKVYK